MQYMKIAENATSARALYGRIRTMKLNLLLGAALAALSLVSSAAQVAGVDYYLLDYLEANGDLYVDTGIPAKMNAAVEAEMACTPASSQSSKYNYMGAVYQQSKGWIAIGDYGEGKLCAYFANGSRSNTGVTIPYDTAFHYYYAGNGLQVIDTTTNTTSVTSEMGSEVEALSIRLFAAQMGFSGTQLARSRVKSFNVYTNGIKALELVPVRRLSDRVLCFYDRVNDAYREKSGAGEFTAGPSVRVLPGGYRQLDYIYSKPASSGSAYTASNDYFVDTGYVPTGLDFGFYFDFRYDGLNSSDAPRIMGSSIKDAESGAWLGVVLPAYSQLKTPVNYGQFCAFGQGFAPKCNPWVVADRRRVLEFKNRLFVAADGSETRFATTNSFGFNGSVWIGNANTADYSDRAGSAPIRIYRFKIYEGDETVHDFVPVLSKEGRVGLLDIRGDKGFRDGPGFFAGPWVPACDFDRCMKLEYAESTGAQYLDTGVVAARNAAIEAVMSVPTQMSLCNVMGAVYGSSGGWIAIGDYGEGSLASYFAISSRAGTGVTIPYDADFHHYFCGNGRQSIDGESNTTTAAKEMAKTINVMAFKADRDFNQKPAPEPQIRLQKLKVYRDDTLIRDFVPVDAEGTVCLYDKVGQQFYLNEGTGSFVAGPRKKAMGLFIVVQ